MIQAGGMSSGEKVRRQESTGSGTNLEERQKARIGIRHPRNGEFWGQGGRMNRGLATAKISNCTGHQGEGFGVQR